MLEPITKKVTDESEGNTYRFAFHCDLCGQPWRSVDYTGNGNANDKERDHKAAYELANIEAARYFNRCPECGRMVCDKCFCIGEQDMCKECAAAREIKAQQNDLADAEVFRPPETPDTESGRTGLPWFRRLFDHHNTGPPRKMR